MWCILFLIAASVSVCWTQLPTPTVSSSSTTTDDWDPIGHSHPHVPRSFECPECLDTRLMQHYLVRGCRPVILGRCVCPSRFECPGNFHTPNATTNNTEREDFKARSVNNGNNNGHEFVCNYNESSFALGEMVPTKDVCRICVCSFLHDGTVGIDCDTQIQCPPTRSPDKPPTGLFGYLAPKNSLIKLSCYPYYHHGQCCPRQECVAVISRTGRTLRPRKTCLYNGKRYKLGEKISLMSILDEGKNETEAKELTEYRKELILAEENLIEEIACYDCICTKSWNDSLFARSNLQLLAAVKEQTESCRKRQCQLEFDHRFRAGCIPVYNEAKCCPVDFICRKYCSILSRNNI